MVRCQHAFGGRSRRKRGELGSSHFPSQGAWKTLSSGSDQLCMAETASIVYQRRQNVKIQSSRLWKQRAHCSAWQPEAVWEHHCGYWSQVLCNMRGNQAGAASSSCSSTPAVLPHPHPLPGCKNILKMKSSAQGLPRGIAQMRGESDFQSQRRDRAQVTIKAFCQNFFPPTENKVFNQTLSG